MSDTKILEGKFKDTIAIWKTDEDGNTVGEYPILSMGKKKLKAILDNIEEIKEFVGEE